MEKRRKDFYYGYFSAITKNGVLNYETNILLQIKIKGIKKRVVPV